MSATVVELEAEDLGLPAVQRARLAEKLIASLDVEPDVDSAWAETVERRHAEIKIGVLSLLPSAETLSRLRAESQ